MKIIYKILRVIADAIIKLILVIFFRLKLVGKENIPKDGAYILCPNHISNWDPVVIAVCTPRRVHFMAKKELFAHKVMNFVSKLYDLFPVNRGNKDIEAIKTSLAILKNGNILGIFPEGTRNGLEKNKKIKNGAAYIALKAKAPVIPVGIKGNYKLFRKVTVTYGKPIDLSVYETNDKLQERENLDKLSQEIMENIITLTK